MAGERANGFEPPESPAGHKDAPIVLDSDETLITDARGGQTPAQIVEQRVAELRSTRGGRPSRTAEVGDPRQMPGGRQALASP